MTDNYVSTWDSNSNLNNWDNASIFWYAKEEQTTIWETKTLKEKHNSQVGQLRDPEADAPQVDHLHPGENGGEIKKHNKSEEKTLFNSISLSILLGRRLHLGERWRPAGAVHPGPHPQHLNHHHVLRQGSGETDREKRLYFLICCCCVGPVFAAAVLATVLVVDAAAALLCRQFSCSYRCCCCCYILTIKILIANLLLFLRCRGHVRMFAGFHIDPSKLFSPSSPPPTFAT